MRLGIIGSGPAAFFLAKRILKRLPESFINFFEARSLPFGLLQYGVAPDHPEIKASEINSVLKILNSSREWFEISLA